MIKVGQQFTIDSDYWDDVNQVWMCLGVEDNFPSSSITIYMRNIKTKELVTRTLDRKLVKIREN